MPKVSPRWYNYLNLGAMALSLLAAAAYIVFRLWQPNLLDIAGLSILATAVSILQLVYGLAFYRIIYNRNPQIAGAISLILLGTLFALLIHNTGGFSSPYYVFWIILSLLSGMFGAGGALATAGLTTLYMWLAGGEAPNAQQGLMLLASYLAAFIGYLFWHVTLKPAQKNAGNAELLKSRLVQEQLKSEFLIRSIADGVVVVDNEGKIQLTNPATSTLTGWKEDEIMGLDYRSVLQLISESGQALQGDQDPFWVALQEQQVASGSLILRTKSKNNLIVSLVVSPISDNQGRLSGVVGVFRDVSREKQAERQRAEFISTASHEMRTPVAAIEGYLSLSLNEKVCRIDTKAREYLTKAYASTQNLGKLFRDLLTAAKSEEGRLANHPRVVEAGNFLMRLSEDLKFAAEKKGLRMEFLTDGAAAYDTKVVRPLYYLYIDPERLREVLTNLFDNAIKFTEEGKVSISLSGQLDKITISITDTGVGIPPEDLPHLFQKFYRVDNSATRTIGGTGLGLFISRNIIEFYKGRVWVESEPGKGSTFFIELPRLAGEKAEELLKQEEAQSSPLGDTLVEKPLA